MNPEATLVLQEVSSGDDSRRDRLFEVVYDDFRRVAHQYVAEAGPVQDLQASDVVHEVYLRLINAEGLSWKDRSHFFAVGAQIMRQVLVDNARKRLAHKRGGAARRISLDAVNEQLKISADCDADVLAVHEAIETLSGINEQRARLVECRFFGGMTVEETSEAIGASKSTIEREWRVARAWLRRELARSRDGSELSGDA